MALFFAPMAISLATSIATRTIGKKALQQAATKYGKPFIQTLQNIGKNNKKIKTTVDKFNKTNKELIKKSKAEKIKVKKKKIDKEKKIKEKKINDKKPLTKVKTGVGTLTANTVKDIKNIASTLNKLTLGGGGKLASAGGKLVSAAAKRPVTTTLGLYGGKKAIDMGTKLFSGGGSKKKSEADITNEVTSNGSTNNKTTTQVGGTGGTDVNDFVAAHNAALDGGQQIFRFDGKAFSVGKTRMSDF